MSFQSCCVSVWPIIGFPPSPTPPPNANDIGMLVLAVLLLPPSFSFSFSLGGLLSGGFPRLPYPPLPRSLKLPPSIPADPSPLLLLLLLLGLLGLLPRLLGDLSKTLTIPSPPPNTLGDEEEAGWLLLFFFEILPLPLPFPPFIAALLLFASSLDRSENAGEEPPSRLAFSPPLF